MLPKTAKDCWEKQRSADVPYFLQDISHESHPLPSAMPVPCRDFIRQLIEWRYISPTSLTPLRCSFLPPEQLSRALRQETSILWAELCVYKENIQPPHLAPTPVLFGGSHISTAAPRRILLRATEETSHWNLLA